ncbi:MAG: hypothetical protein OEZ65_08155 [Gemmatimonadota bacterium]|nr:hypothetical protein [Gemmatimonadota bacterium]
MHVTIRTMLSILALATVLPAGAGAQTCEWDAARMLARVFRLSNAMMASEAGELVLQDPAPAMVRYVEEHAKSLDGEGVVVTCGMALGRALRERGRAAFDVHARERATSMWQPGMSTEVPGDVASSINSAAVDLALMGEELQWLMGVLPQAARGNWQPYLATGTYSRRQTRQIMATMAALMAVDPEMASVMAGAPEEIARYSPLLEEQIVMLAVGIVG